MTEPIGNEARHGWRDEAAKRWRDAGNLAESAGRAGRVVEGNRCTLIAGELSQRLDREGAGIETAMVKAVADQGYGSGGFEDVPFVEPVAGSLS